MYKITFLASFLHVLVCGMQVFKLINYTLTINIETSAIRLYLNVTSMDYINAIQNYTKLR